LVLNLFWHTLRCSDTAPHTCVLDNAFALIEGHLPIRGLLNRVCKSLYSAGYLGS